MNGIMNFSHLKEKILKWCLSEEAVIYGELYKQYQTNKVERYQQNKLKFVEESEPNDLFIKTPSGISPIKRLLKTVEYDVYRITLENELFLECADEHLLIGEYGDAIFAKDSKGTTLRTIKGPSAVVSVEPLNRSESMYDIEIDGDDHTYHTNGILSHNTTCAAAFFLWYATFEEHKTVLIVSNKESNATEFIHRLQVMYEYLPKWLKAGVDGEWNKKSVGFDNGCRVISRATSDSSARGLSLSIVFADELAFVRDNIQDEFWAALSPTLSCVTGDTLVLTKNGYEKIEDFHKGKGVGDYFEIDGVEVYGKEGIEPLSHGYVSPESDTLIIETQRGFMIEVTHNHPLYALTENPEMVKAKNLTTANYLRIDYGMNHFGKKSLDSDIAYMLGGYIAEGWSSHFKNAKGERVNSAIYIANLDSDFREVFYRNGFSDDLNQSHKIRKFGVDVCRFWENEYGINFTQKCYDKEIPHYIMQSNSKTIGMFLRGLYDGDGSITVNRGINLTSTSRKLIQQVQILLMNFGILTTLVKNDAEKIMIRERESCRLLPQGKPIQSLRDSWGLNISRSNAGLFQRCVGFNIKYKGDKLEECIKKYPQDDYKQKVIPFDIIKNVISNIVESSGKTKKWFRDKGCRLDKLFNKSTERTCTLRWLEVFYKAVRHMDCVAQYHNIFNELLGYDCIWDKIKTITPSTNKTYDFTVPKTHTFLQNGILGSNTGGSCIVASTPNGDMNLFAQLARASEAKTNEFVFKKYIWEDVPERDEAWKKSEIMRIGEEKFLQEHLCHFLSSEAMLISSMVLSTIKPKQHVRELKEFKLWDSFSPEKSYIVGVDPSTGIDNDFSVIEVFEFPTMIQVGEFRSNTCNTTQLYQALKGILIMMERVGCQIFYSSENNGIGEGLLVCIENDENAPEHAEFVTQANSKREGFATTNKSKIKACIKLREMFESGKIEIKSEHLLFELKNFIRTKASYEAQPGATDDCISAVLIVIRILEEIILYDDRAYAMMEESLGEDYFSNDVYDENGVDAAMPIVF